MAAYGFPTASTRRTGIDTSDLHSHRVVITYADGTERTRFLTSRTPARAEAWVRANDARADEIASVVAVRTSC
jgi:hypothetical protein